MSVFAGRGNDKVLSVGRMNWQMRFFGEEGRDLLVGTPSDLLDGGPGKNVIIVKSRRLF